MAWREPTEDDVFAVLNALETAAYNAKAAAVGQDVMGDALMLVTHFCRGYIADNRENTLAAGMTLPERVIRSAMHLVRKDLLTRLNLEVSEDRRKDAAEAIRFFERVADGKVTLEQPEGVELDMEGPVQVIETVSNHERQATRRKLAGL